MTRVYDFFGGRSTFFAFVCLGIGTGLAFAGKLDGTYIGLIGAVQGLVTVRAIAEDLKK